MVNKPLTLLLLVVCALVFACKSDINHHTAGEKKYHLGLHLRAGGKYYYNISNKTLITLEVNDKKIESSNESEIGLIYEILKDSADLFVLKITYDKLHVVLKKQDVETEIDGTNGNNSLDPVERVVGKIIGASIVITLNTKGDILNVTGYQELSDKLLAALPTQDLKTKEAVQGQLTQLVGGAFVKNNLEQGFKIFPDTAVFIGDSWMYKNKQSADEQLKLLTKYTLASINKDIATIEATSEINNTGKNNNIGGYEVDTEVKGTQSGQFKADVATGMLQYATTKASMEGSVQLLGKEAPIIMKIKKEISGRKL